jgi:hypothetical protein
LRWERRKRFGLRHHEAETVGQPEPHVATDALKNAMNKGKVRVRPKG